MNKNQIKSVPKYFDRYINYVPDMDIVPAMHKYGIAYLSEEKDKMTALKDIVYAPGKWTIKDILQHIIDTERIFSYRALRFARKDQTELPGFDENTYAAFTTANDRSIDDLLLEFAAVRQSTLGLFLSFDEQMMQEEGTASGNKISVLALGFTLTGHVLHHMQVIKERYYPLLHGSSESLL